MTKVEKLISAMAESSKFGKGVFSKAELAYLLNVEQTPRFNKFLLYHVYQEAQADLYYLPYNYLNKFSWTVQHFKIQSES